MEIMDLNEVSRNQTLVFITLAQDTLKIMDPDRYMRSTILVIELLENSFQLRRMQTMGKNKMWERSDNDDYYEDLEDHDPPNNKADPVFVFSGLEQHSAGTSI